MMRQYLEVKAERPDCLVLMRMGDFYEAFLEDALELSRLCGVALTARNKDAEQPIAMAGVPHHSLRGHLPKLLAAGKRVAVMDQLEDAKEAKGLVRRGVTRVITPGTALEEMESSAANWLVACTGLDGAVGVAALDVSTGHFTVELAAQGPDLALILGRLQPAELVLPEAVRDAVDTSQRLARLLGRLPTLSILPPYAWKPADARRLLLERLRVASLEGFGIGSGDDLLAAAAAAALRYAEGALRAGEERSGAAAAQAGSLAHIRTISRIHHSQHLVLDGACRRNLELVRNSRDGGRDGTLLAAIDRTRTAPGARLLADWLVRPLAQPEAINRRLDGVASLVADDPLRADMGDQLAHAYDLERLLARVATGRVNARDLVQLAGTLDAAARVGRRLAAAPLLDLAGSPGSLLAEAAAALAPVPGLAAAIAGTLVEDPPLAISDGGLVRDGVDADLDALRAIRRDAGSWLAEYQLREAERCGMTRLKVGYNKVFGYYIEVSKAKGEQVPAHFIRKQTLIGAERYITQELKEYEDKALGAEDRIRARELELFAVLRERAAAAVGELQGCATALALVDVLAGLAEVARSGGWTRPVIDQSADLEVVAGRHPVVEQVVGRGAFVANDARLRARSSDPAMPRLAVITGPNMAGKSTYIRQVALVVILAQTGSFVPADAARIGVVDRLFTRVGAGDELARNLSTFMVEMAETAAILNHASASSLVVLDEVGRGTSTFDGVSLAWAITEHLHDRIGCRALFATHYHELADLADDRPGIANLSVAVAEQDEDVVFLHRIVRGAAAKSYGIHVARLAGVPPSVVARAWEILTTLEQLNLSLAERERPAAREAGAGGGVQLTLFEVSQSQTLQRLKALDLDGLTPRQALDLLFQLKTAAQSET
jgi:DNA mismatch repair protein MutS